MKKNIITTAILSTSLLFSCFTLSAEAASTSTQLKHWSVGVGSYAFSIANSEDSESSSDFSGFDLSAGYAFNNHFQIRGTYFQLENDEFGELESSGIDLMAYGGVGLAKSGFRGYGGAGFFSDEWKASRDSESFSGFQFGGGLGYNWGPVALDFVLKLRQADKYEDFMYETGTYLAISGNLNVSYLF